MLLPELETVVPERARYSFGRKLTLSHAPERSERVQVSCEVSLDSRALSSRAPLPYQSHRRILGWKLTSPERRKDMIRLLDPPRHHGKKGGSSDAKLRFRGGEVQVPDAERTQRTQQSSRTGADESRPSDGSNSLLTRLRPLDGSHTVRIGRGRALVRGDVALRCPMPASLKKRLAQGCR